MLEVVCDQEGHCQLQKMDPSKIRQVGLGGLTPVLLPYSIPVQGVRKQTGKKAQRGKGKQKGVMNGGAKQKKKTATKKTERLATTQIGGKKKSGGKKKQKKAGCGGTVQRKKPKLK